MSNKLTNISKEKLQNVIDNNTTYGGVLRHFGLTNQGNNHRLLKTRIMIDNLNASHISKFKSGPAWNIGLRQLNGLKTGNTKLSKEDAMDIIFKKGHEKRKQIRFYVRHYNLIDEVCLECGMKPYWNNKPLVLHLDHINGDPCNNELSNLRWLCPNCHSQTNTYARNKSGVRRKK
jgi:hypothetical protein